jgi:hypothetical protein
LAKVFDCVNHKILLTKLHFIGIQGTSLSWFRSYLTDRKQKIEIKSIQSTYSNWGSVKRGDPQWRILGPLLVITYINDVHLINTYNIC